jgi:hypothetical protein
MYKYCFDSAVLVVMVLTFPNYAFAYLDPGTGSMIIQGVIAAISAGLFAGRIYWGKIKKLFSMRSDEDTKKINH